MNDKENDVKGFNLDEFLNSLDKTDGTSKNSPKKVESALGASKQDKQMDDGGSGEGAALDKSEDEPKMEEENSALKETASTETATENQVSSFTSSVPEQSDEFFESYTDGEKKKGKKGLFIALAAILVLLAAMGGTYAFLSAPLTDAKKEQIYESGVFEQGISVFDVDVSGETMEEAKNKLSGKINFSAEQTLLELKLKDKVIPVKASDLNISNTMDAVLKDAILYGKDGHLLKRLMDKSEAKKNGKNFDVAIYTDDASLNNLVETIVANNSIEPKDADVTINKDSSEKFTFTPEEIGYKISAEGLAEKIKTHIEKRETGYIELEYTETQPKVKQEDLKKNLVLRSTYSTNVSGATGRRKNIIKAAEKINGKKVMPGEEFNIENELGPRNAANGWNVGGEFVNGELVSGYGGGICQASTTLFNAVIRADLEVVKRSSHSQTVGYVPLGFDATISSGGPYFIWKNNTDYPIFIFANASMSKITVELYGAPLPYGDNITYEELVSATGTVTSGKRVTSALVFKKDGKEVHRITWGSSYRGKPVKVTTTKATTTGATTTGATTAASDVTKKTTAQTTKPSQTPTPTTNATKTTTKKTTEQKQTTSSKVATKKKPKKS